MNMSKEFYITFLLKVIVPSVLLQLLLVQGAVAEKVEIPTPKRNLSIGYINKEIPKLTAGTWKGKRYEVLVPDTLDLAERATLAIHGITNIQDPDYDYELFWLAEFNRIPPVMIHQTLGPPWLDGENYKLMESLALLRLITGSRSSLEIDQRWRERTLQQIGPDGLAYWPEKGRPWLSMDVPPGGWKPALGDTSQGQISTLGMSGRLIAAMTLYGLQDQNPVWKQTIEKMINRLAELTVYKGNYGYLPAAAVAPGAEVPADFPEPSKGSWRYAQAWLIQGLTQYYRQTHHEPARDLAMKLTRYLMGPSENYDSDGAFVGMDHFHMNTQGVLAISDLALATGDPELAEFARKTYKHGKSIGDDLVGFFPEGLRYLNEDGSYEHKYRSVETAETCEVADMIVSGLKLADLGYDDCWDDVDRWLRNQFAENQMTHADWIYRLIDKESVPAGSKPLPDRKKGEGRSLYSGRPIAMPINSPHENGDRVPERHIGTFAGWPSGNDFFYWDPETHGHLGAMHCCTGNGSRAIYYAWEHILDYRDETLRINLLLNRASPWADVDSYIPYEGQVDIKMKKTCNLEVRIPEWVKPEQTVCTVNGKKKEITFRGRYAQFGRVKKGDVAVTHFPIVERTVRTKIGGNDYTLVVKGNTVVFMDPPGKWCPLYQRDHYRDNQVRWVERERFVGEGALHW